jgi:GxxExxY protein
MPENDPLTERIISCCFKVHSELGPGFNEKVYHNSLIIMLGNEGLQHETEKRFPVMFQNKKVGQLIVDLLVENTVVLEVKAVTGYLPEVFKHQTISYLKATKLKVGLLVNFGNKSCKVKRFVNTSA